MAGPQERVVPRHVAIVMDGNGRWARRRHLPREAGHAAGVRQVREIVRAAHDLGIALTTSGPNNALQLTASSLCSYLAAASGSS